MTTAKHRIPFGQMLSNDEIKLISFEGLRCLTESLDKHSLAYCLAYGTLLGAVRHQGFIPWDDDIDIWMPREDYDRLLSNPSMVENDSWELLSYRTTEGYTLSWAKYCHRGSVVWPSRFNSGLLYGCSIDIFPLDHVPAESIDEAIKKCDSVNTIYKALCSQYRHTGVLRDGWKNSIKRVLKSLYFSINCKLRGSWPQRLAQVEDQVRQQWTTGDYAAYVLVDVQCVWPYEDFGWDKSPTLLFEGERFKVPVNWHDILTRRYGDYLVLPPVEERVTRHTYKGIYRI